MAKAGVSKAARGGGEGKQPVGERRPSASLVSTLMKARATLLMRSESGCSDGGVSARASALMACALRATPLDRRLGEESAGRPGSDSLPPSPSSSSSSMIAFR